MADDFIADVRNQQQGVAAHFQRDQLGNQQVHALQLTVDQIDRIRSLFVDTQKTDPKLAEADREIVHKLDQAAIRARYEPSEDEVAKSSQDLAQRATLRLRF